MSTQGNMTPTERLCLALGREPVEDASLAREAEAWLAREAEDVELLWTFPEPAEPSFAMIERGEWLIARLGLEGVRARARSAPWLYGPLYRRAAWERGVVGIVEELEAAFEVQAAREAAVPWLKAFEPTGGIAVRLAAAIERQRRHGPVPDGGNLVERQLPACRLAELFDVCDRIEATSPEGLRWGDDVHVASASLPSCALGVAAASGGAGELETCLTSASRSRLSLRTAVWVASRLEPSDGARRSRLEALDAAARREPGLVMDEAWLEARALGLGAVEATHPGRLLRVVREAAMGWEDALRRLLPREPWESREGLEIAAVALRAVVADGRPIPATEAVGSFLGRWADDGGHGGALYAAAWREPKLRDAVSTALCSRLGSGGIGGLRRQLGLGEEFHAEFLREVVSRGMSHEVGALVEVEELRAALAVLPEVGFAECVMLLLHVTIDAEFGAFLDGFVRLHAEADRRVPENLGPSYQMRWMRRALGRAAERPCP